MLPVIFKISQRFKNSIAGLPVKNKFLHYLEALGPRLRGKFKVSYYPEVLIVLSQLKFNIFLLSRNFGCCVTIVEN